MVSPGGSMINYIIAGILCVANIQSTNLCFDVRIPVKFETLAECDFKMKQLISVLHQDFEERGIYMRTRCFDETQLNGKNIVWTTTG